MADPVGPRLKRGGGETPGGLPRPGTGSLGNATDIKIAVTYWQGHYLRALGDQHFGNRPDAFSQEQHRTQLHPRDIAEREAR